MKNQPRKLLKNSDLNKVGKMVALEALQEEFERDNNIKDIVSIVQKKAPAINRGK